MHASLSLYNQAQNEATLKEMRSLRERLNLSERAAEALKSDLSAMVAQRDHGQAEMHQARLQAAQLTLQLADSSLAMREGRARWAQERQNLQRTAEVSLQNVESDVLMSVFYTRSNNFKVNVFHSDVCVCVCV